jgi:TonB-linked SusC/RagA family outer membrane protein
MKMFILSFLVVLSVNASSYSQNTRLQMDIKEKSIRDVLRSIEERTRFRFFYNDEFTDLNKTISLKAENENIEDLLADIFHDSEVTYKILDNNFIVITPNSIKQELEIQGTITDGQTGEPLPGVNILVEGTSTGVITDVYGKYTISLPSKDVTLVFSFVGYLTEKIIVGDKTTIDISLVSDIAKLDEVVVVGYGTMKKSDLTGSVSQVKGEDLSVVSGANPIQALQGRAAGVSILTNNSPGERPTIRIRGSGSISAGNNPLVVVDGFPLVDGNINDFNPNDIESVEILKDASAAAIYGSRGANGVIMITTKKGAPGVNNLTFNSYYGIQSPARLVEMLNRDEFISFINDAYTYSHGRPVYRDTIGFYAPSHNTDWQDEIILDNSAVQEHSMTYSGGTNATTYMISSGLYSQDGIISNSGYKRFNVHSNLQHKFSDWLTVGSHIHVSRSDRDSLNGSPENLFRWGWPTMPIKNDDGSWYYASLDPQHSAYVEGNWNPIADVNEIINQVTTNRILSDLFAEVTLAKGLTFRTNFGVDHSNAKKYYYATSKHSSGMSSNGKGEQNYFNKTTRITENILKYTKTIEKHRLTATGVYSYQDYMYESMRLSGSGFPTDVTGANNMELINAESVDYGSNKYSSKLISWTARAAYSYKNKYLLTTTGRYDGSSRFGKNNKWAFFPSIGLGWRINQEKFMQNADAFSNLKLHASYGITGNQEISNYASLPRLDGVNYVYGNSPILGFKEGIGNPDLKWEKTAQLDIGLDIGLFNRVNVIMAYYKRNTTDLLYKVPIPTTSGFSSMLQNIGEVENKGIEFSVDSRVIDREVKWNINFNITRNKNQIVKLYGDVDRIEVGENQGIAEILVVGEPVNSVWARESKGIIKTQDQLEDYLYIRPTAQLGEEMYADNEVDSSINRDDYINIGTTEPDFYFGISTSVQYKGLTLSIYTQGAKGIASKATDYLLYGENQIQNRNYIPSKYAYDRMWSDANPGGSFPRAGAREVFLSDRTNGNRNYFIIKNIKLSYNLKHSLLNDSKWVKGITIYGNLQNYFCFSNFRGYNPENGDIDYPLAKAVIFGVNAKF